MGLSRAAASFGPEGFSSHAALDLGPLPLRTSGNCGKDPGFCFLRPSPVLDKVGQNDNELFHAHAVLRRRGHATREFLPVAMNYNQFTLVGSAPIILCRGMALCLAFMLTPSGPRTFAQHVDSLTLTVVNERPYPRPIGSFKYDWIRVDIDSQHAEWRLIYDGKHFATVIQNRGNVVIRGAPGLDMDGWGLSQYIRPFFPSVVNMHGLDGFQIIGYENAEQGLSLLVTGSIPYGYTEADTTGRFTFNTSIQYDSTNKAVKTKGTCVISLAATVGALGHGDLNLGKMATAKNLDVPLLSGGIGDTGDTGDITVSGNNLNFVWNVRTHPSHFPQDFTDWLNIQFAPSYNEIDSVRQGYAPIKGAYKPGFGLCMTSQVPNLRMIFGGVCDLSQAPYYWYDNVGVTPLVLASDWHTNFAFDVSTTWNSHANDGSRDELNVVACEGTNMYLGVYHTKDLQVPMTRIGSLKAGGTSSFVGTIKIDRADQGYIRVRND